MLDHPHPVVRLYGMWGQLRLAVGAFSLLILMLTLVLSARSRELTMARLATMGLGPAQSRRKRHLLSE